MPSKIKSKKERTRYLAIVQFHIFNCEICKNYPIGPSKLAKHLRLKNPGYLKWCLDQLIKERKLIKQRGWCNSSKTLYFFRKDGN